MFKRIVKMFILCALKRLNHFWNGYLASHWQSYSSAYFTDWLYRYAGHCGDGCRVNGKITVSDPRLLTIGNNVHIGNNCYFRSQGGIIIGDHSHLSRNIIIYSESHSYEGDRLPYDSTTRKKPVIIERNVWIGMNVKIRPGITIGEGAIIGLGEYSQARSRCLQCSGEKNGIWRRKWPPLESRRDCQQTRDW